MADVIQPIYHSFNLGFDTEDIKRVEIAQDSDRTHILAIKLYTNDDQMELNPNWNYHITMRKPDGKLIVNTENISVENNIIYVICTAQMLSAPGTSKCQLVIYNGSQSLYSNNFYIYVDRDLISGDEIESTNEFNSIVRVLRQLEQYANLASAAADNAAASADSAEEDKDRAEEYLARIQEILNSLDDYDEEINDLINNLRNKSNEIETLKQQVLSAIDDITTIINQLNELGVDNLAEIVTNAHSLYDEMLDLSDAITYQADEIENTYDAVIAASAGVSAKVSEIDTKYNEFISKVDGLTDIIEQSQTMLQTISQMMNSVSDMLHDIENDKESADNDSADIAAMKREIEEILEYLREEAQGGLQLDDPIIVSDIQPGASEQKKDDMWLEPYAN